MNQRGVKKCAYRAERCVVGWRIWAHRGNGPEFFVGHIVGSDKMGWRVTVEKPNQDPEAHAGAAETCSRRIWKTAPEAARGYWRIWGIATAIRLAELAEAA